MLQPNAGFYHEICAITGCGSGVGCTVTDYEVLAINVHGVPFDHPVGLEIAAPQVE